jgi:hypothetical protein
MKGMIFGVGVEEEQSSTVVVKKAPVTLLGDKKNSFRAQCPQQHNLQSPELPTFDRDNLEMESSNVDRRV